MACNPPPTIIAANEMQEKELGRETTMRVCLVTFTVVFKHDLDIMFTSSTEDHRGPNMMFQSIGKPIRDRVSKYSETAHIKKNACMESTEGRSCCDVKQRCASLFMFNLMWQISFDGTTTSSTQNAMLGGIHNV